MSRAEVAVMFDLESKVIFLLGVSCFRSWEGSAVRERKIGKQYQTPLYSWEFLWPSKWGVLLWFLFCFAFLKSQQILRLLKEFFKEYFLRSRKVSVEGVFQLTQSKNCPFVFKGLSVGWGFLNTSYFLIFCISESLDSFSSRSTFVQK